MATQITTDQEISISEVIEDFNDKKFGTYFAVRKIQRIVDRLDDDTLGYKIEAILLNTLAYSNYTLTVSTINIINMTE